MSDYHKLSVADKERVQRESLREPAIPCPYCEAKTTVADLLAHIEKRCPGERPMHPQMKWVSWREALTYGVKRKSLSRWASNGDVRVDGRPGRRRYLLRDIVRMMAKKNSTVGQTESVTSDTAEKQTANTLTKRAAKDPRRPMGKPLDETTMQELKAFATSVGGLAAAGRKLDVPVDTLRRAAAGERLRAGTRLLIAAKLAEREAE